MNATQNVGATARIESADAWAEDFSEVTRNNPIKGKFQKALAVMVLDANIRRHLAEHNPMALRQAMECFTPGKSYCNYAPVAGIGAIRSF